MNKVHSLLSSSKLSIANHKNRSVGILLQGSEPQEDTSLNIEGYDWNPKHPGGIAIKIKKRIDLYLVNRNTGIRRAVLNSRNENSTVFVDKIPHDSRRIGMHCANSNNAINHVDGTLN